MGYQKKYKSGMDFSEKLRASNAMCVLKFFNRRYRWCLEKRADAANSSKPDLALIQVTRIIQVLLLLIHSLQPTLGVRNMNRIHHHLLLNKGH